MAIQENMQTKQVFSTDIRTLAGLLQGLGGRDVLLSLLLMLVGLALWAVSLPAINLHRMNDLGLISAMPPGSFVALALLTTGFTLVIRRPKPAVALAVLQLAVLLFMQHGITALIEPISRFGPAWRHVGVVDYILRNGSVNPRIDAYFNWPGFFGLGALLTEAAGLENAAVFLPWASLVFEVLYLFPLWMIYTQFSTDRRLAWAGLWVFALSNWVGQDYFSPQGLNFFFYLVVIAILLKWFRAGAGQGIPALLARATQRFSQVNMLVERLLTPASPEHAAAVSERAAAALTYGRHRRRRPKRHISEMVASLVSDAYQPRLLMAVLVAVYTAAVVSHQLTPFALLIAASALALVNLTSARRLPALMLVLLAIWIGQMAWAFMGTRISLLLGQAGNVDALLGANLIDRMTGSPGHQVVVYVRMLLTAGLWLAAAAGAVRRWRAGFTDTAPILLALSPFLLLGMAVYGGEMLLRVFLFSLPFAAFLAAGLFFPKPVVRPSLRQLFAFAAVTAAVAGCFFLVRYGNERMESFTFAEQRAVQYLYETAPEGSLLAASSSHLPYKYQDYEKYHYALFSTAVLTGDLHAIIARMSSSSYPSAYLILTRSQAAHLEMFYGFDAADLTRFKETLMSSGRFRRIYSNNQADIYKLVPRGAG